MSVSGWSCRIVSIGDTLGKRGGGFRRVARDLRGVDIFLTKVVLRLEQSEGGRVRERTRIESP